MQRAKPKATKRAKRAPSPTAAYGGRDPKTGKFAKGNRIATGNPLASQVGRLRSTLIECVSPSDMKAIGQTLVRLAKAGDLAAARLLLSYTLGSPVELDLVERIERLESAAAFIRGVHREETHRKA